MISYAIHDILVVLLYIFDSHLANYGILTMLIKKGIRQVIIRSRYNLLW